MPLLGPDLSPHLALARWTSHLYPYEETLPATSSSLFLEYLVTKRHLTAHLECFFRN
jgi:hypothetical protein